MPRRCKDADSTDTVHSKAAADRSIPIGCQHLSTEQRSGAFAQLLRARLLHYFHEKLGVLWGMRRAALYEKTTLLL
eukprot:3939068-Pyramimonas_sp.AAC.1